MKGNGRRGRLAAVQLAMTKIANERIKDAAALLSSQMTHSHGESTSDSKALVMLADGLLKLCQGVHEDANARLRGALSMARQTMRSTQLLTQAMLLIGSMLLKSDVKTAKESLQASLQLGREIGPIPTVVVAAERLEASESAGSRQGKTHVGKKRKRHESLMNAATDKSEHASVCAVCSE